jgi:hypothetical protein
VCSDCVRKVAIAHPNRPTQNPTYLNQATAIPGGHVECRPVYSACSAGPVAAKARPGSTSMHGGHVIFVIRGSSCRWGRSSIPDPTMHTSLAAIPIFVLVIADGRCRCARARKGDRAGSCQITGAVEVRESRYRELMKNHGQFVRTGVARD